MTPLCPSCLTEMTQAAGRPNLFNCTPCREIIAFFDGRTDDRLVMRERKVPVAVPATGKARAA